MTGPSGNVSELYEIELRYFVRNYMNGKTRAALPSNYGDNAHVNFFIWQGILRTPSIITISPYNYDLDYVSPEYPIFGTTPQGYVTGQYPTCKRFDMLLYNTLFNRSSTYSLRRSEPDHKAIIEEIKKQEPRYETILDSSGNQIFQIKI